MSTVGEMLASHASGLSQATKALITDAMAADDHQKALAFARRKEAMALPPFKYQQHIVYDRTEEDGTVTKCVVTYHLLIPSVILVDGRSLEIQKYEITSTFEAMIKKSLGVQSETTVNVGGKVGLWFPEISFDVTQKIGVDSNSESSQHNTMDVHIEMGQSEASFGYVELVKALMRCITTILDDVQKKGLNNPKVISEDDAKKLEEGEDEAQQDNQQQQPTQ